MATELGKAFVQIVPSARGISGSITNALKGESDAAGQAAGMSLSSKMIGVLKTAGIGLALKKTISEGANLEQSIGGIETLFKGSADKMKAYAATAYREAGISANDYMEQATSFAASLLQSVGGDTAKAAEAADGAIKDMADNAAKMGTNIQDIQNAYQGFAKGNYTMLDNLKLGYGGTKTEMERLLAKAEELSGQKYDINNLNDVYSAIHEIQDSLDIAGVAGDEAKTTISGSFNAMKASATNLLGALTLGDEGIESVQTAMGDLVSSAGTFLFGNLLPAIGRIAAGLPEALITGISTAMPLIAENASKLITAFTTALQTSIPALIEKAPIMFEQFMSNLGDSSAMIAKAGTLLVNLGNALISNAPKLMMSATHIITILGTYLQENGPKIMAAAGQIVAKLALGLIKNLPKLALGLVKLSTALLKFVGSLPEMALNGAKGFIKGLLSPLTSGLAKVKAFIRNLKNLLKLKLSFPHIKVPHFTITGGKIPWGIGGAGTKPTVSVKWYKTGGIFSDPSVIGVGEAGDEAVVPLKQLWNQMDKHSGNIDYELMADALVKALSSVNITSTTNLDGKVVARQTAPLIRRELNSLDARQNRKLGYI